MSELIDVLKDGDGGIDAVRGILRSGSVDVNEKDKKYGRTALMLAAKHGRIEIVKELLDCHCMHHYRP